MHEYVRLAVGAVPAAYTGVIPEDVVDLHGVHTRFRSTHFDGFGRPDAAISFASAASGNFSTYMGSRVTERNLEWDIDILGDQARGMDLLNRAMPFGVLRRFYIVDAGGKEVYIDGVVEKLPDDVDTSKSRTTEISVLCPFPWFTSVQRHEKVILEGQPLDVDTDGDIDAGFSLHITNGAEVTGLRLEDNRGNSIGLAGTVQFGNLANDNNPAICTVDGSIGTYNSGGKLQFARVASDAEWFQIPRNGIRITLSAQDGAPSGVLRWHDYYSGVTM